METIKRKRRPIDAFVIALLIGLAVLAIGGVHQALATETLTLASGPN